MRYRYVDKAKMLFQILLTHSLLYVTFGELSCKSENGHSVDWLIVYKLPRIHNANSQNPFLATGDGYAYLSATESSKWILSKQNISSYTSAIARSLSSITESKNNAYLAYNDEVPGKMQYSRKWGHTKGVVAFDDKTAYWLIHSVPKFPVIGHYQFPVASKENGQIFICVTYNFSAVNQIGNQLRYMKPQIYMHQPNSMVSKLSPLVQSLFTKHPSFIRKPPWYNVAPLINKNGLRFISFSKHSRFHNDLYDSLVAPNLQSSLYTETWMRGSGIPLPSNCSLRYPVWNVKSINMSVYYNTKMKHLGFLSTSDHSKWAVSAKGDKQWTCIGDINRMKSQEMRGGGTLCFKSNDVWRNFQSAVSTTEDCHHTLAYLSGLRK